MTISIIILIILIIAIILIFIVNQVYSYTLQYFRWNNGVSRLTRSNWKKDWFAKYSCGLEDSPHRHYEDSHGNKLLITWPSIWKK